MSGKGHYTLLLYLHIIIFLKFPLNWPILKHPLYHSEIKTEFIHNSIRVSLSPKYSHIDINQKGEIISDYIMLNKVKSITNNNKNI